MQEVNIKNQAAQETEAFDRREAARRLGVSVVTVDRELAKNRLPHFRIGRRVLFTEVLLAEYRDRQRQN